MIQKERLRIADGKREMVSVKNYSRSFTEKYFVIKKLDLQKNFERCKEEKLKRKS